MNKLEKLEKQVELYEKNIESQQQSLETLKRELEQLKAEKVEGVWQPKFGDKFWFLTLDGCVRFECWLGSDWQNGLYATGNIFQTKEEAEFRVEQLKVEAELRRFSRPFVPNENNYQLNYAHNSKSLYIDCVRNIQSNDIYFETADILREAIKVVGKDRIKKYYFGVED